jgi:hypothetical protein
MSTRFPGMDPYIESQRWDDFHASFVPILGELLVPQIRPAYTADIAYHASRSKFLTIRTRRSRDDVSVIELLSPECKSYRRGHKQYLEQRARYLQSNVNLIELDLLRGGERLTVDATLPGGDYFAIVTKPRCGPTTEIWAWELYDKMPVIAVPLSKEEPAVVLDLQTAFERTYERGGYDYALDYNAPFDPPLLAID